MNRSQHKISAAILFLPRMNYISFQSPGKKRKSVCVSLWYCNSYRTPHLGILYEATNLVPAYHLPCPICRAPDGILPYHSTRELSISLGVGGDFEYEGQRDEFPVSHRQAQRFRHFSADISRQFPRPLLVCGLTREDGSG